MSEGGIDVELQPITAPFEPGSGEFDIAVFVEDPSALPLAVNSDLARSKLAIHPIGSNYGLIPEGDRRSVIRLQNDLAAAQSRVQGLARLIWIPDETNLTSEKQQQFIDHLKNDADSYFEADFLNTGIEDLKTAIRDQLNGEPKQVPTTACVGDLVREKIIPTFKRIYHIRDGRTVEEAGEGRIVRGGAHCTMSADQEC